MMRIIIGTFHIFKLCFLWLKYSVLILFQKESVEQFLEKKEAKTLVFTHILGGGTEQYVKNNFYKKDYLIVRKVAYLDKDLFFLIEDKINNKTIYLRFNTLNKLFSKNWNSIVINSLCWYADISEILILCVKAKIANPNMNMLYLLHDFHCICPNQNLFTDGFYCNLQCEKHKCKYLILEWRNTWQKFLEKCDEIRCFSKSSKEILMTVYKTLDGEKITVIPHNMSYSKFTTIKIEEKNTPVFGVVGACQLEIKGNKVLKTILKNIPENIPFVFVGTKKSQLKTNRKNVIFLGKYRHDELQDILEKKNVTHIIFPSVWPETFSYVVSEIMQMNLPIMCFNIGAQAEKVSKYNKGIVCESVEDMIKKIKQNIK